MRLLRLLYVSAFVFLSVMVIVTAYVLSHPELGLVETNPLVRAYMAGDGLVGALLIAMLVNSSVLIVSWLFFTLYRMFRGRYEWNNNLTDSTAYSIVAAVGICALITWLLDAINDIYVLLFLSDQHPLAVTLELWTSIAGYLVLAIFFVLFVSVHYLARKGQREARVVSARRIT